MIPLTRLDGTLFWLNRRLVQTVEATPDTLIVLTTGRRMLVKEPVEDVVRAMADGDNLRPLPNRVRTRKAGGRGD